MKGASEQTKQMQYSESMKARMIKRMTGPDAMSANALSKEVGIAQSTLSHWLRAAGTFTPVPKKKRAMPAIESTTTKQNRRAQDWTTLEKMRVVIEAENLSEGELGAFLRREGLHREQLEQWRIAAAEALGQPTGRRSRSKPGPTPEQKRIRELERQLRHKEKALAEAAALLVLKKKYETLFGDEDDNTDPTSEE
jgi:transposase-like protein